MAEIVLATLNARYSHASLGLRYLHANLGELRNRAEIIEFVIGARTESMAETILSREPRLLGLGVYIWNVEETTRLVALLKRLAPELRIVLGGPEVSHEVSEQPICRMADHVITGMAEHEFAELCRQTLAWKAGRAPRPLTHVISGGRLEPADITMPYALYDDRDIAHRHLYVEASRGCPYRCEFCLSALDRTAVPFPLERLLDELATLHQRGARRFRFVDRTFNLRIDTSLAILAFFLQRIEARPDDPCFAHFELVPDHLPERLRDILPRFPAGTLQFEIGIQSWNTEVQALISRRQNNVKAEENLRWLREHTRANLHVDLIAGLPGETIESFGAGFDRLVALNPQEIQVGILKRLRGAPISRHTEAFDLRFNPSPPYNVLATRDIPFSDMQRLARFARYWELIGNSGRFSERLPLLLGAQPFDRFLAFSDWIYARTDSTWRFSPDRLVQLIDAWLISSSEIEFHHGTPEEPLHRRRQDRDSGHPAPGVIT
jgi:radical SAM superfamily enzyme YgiQ (UPF0313 family)